MTDDARGRLEAALADADAQLADLDAAHAEVVAASQDSNADDEHDPEGATIAFERQQVAALQAAVRRSRADVLRALELLDEGTYGVCERCGGPVGEARLEARPTARRCIACAALRG